MVVKIARRIVRLLTDKPPIRHNHTYTDLVTGERFEIDSVGRWVEISRLDAERRPGNRVRKGTMRDAIAEGLVTHDPDTCPACDTR